MDKEQPKDKLFRVRSGETNPDGTKDAYRYEVKITYQPNKPKVI